MWMMWKSLPIAIENPFLRSREGRRPASVNPDSCSSYLKAWNNTSLSGRAVRYRWCPLEPLVPRFRRLVTGLVRASVFGLHLDNYRIIQFCTEDLYGTAGHQLRNAVRRR